MGLFLQRIDDSHGSTLMIEFYPIPFITGLIILIAAIRILKFRGKTAAYLIPFSLMGGYLLIVIGLTLFPIPIPVENNITFKDQIASVIFQINLVPFRYLTWFTAGPLRFEILMNILLTVPFGFLINYFSKINWGAILWISIASGYAIETSQLIMSFFFGAYRTVDISDVILNTLGTLFGFLLFKLSRLFFLKMSD